MDNKTYSELTEKEIEQRSTLTPEEKVAVDAFISAARALPKLICIDFYDGELSVKKRITKGSAQQVAFLRKKSLEF